MNGYTTGGIYIPGRYYKFLNFDKVQGVRGAGPPEIHDFQLEYALWVEHLKVIHKNAYLPKARRKTISACTVGMVTDYGLRFHYDYHCAVVAGLDEHAQDFVDKWKYVDMHMVDEFKARRLYTNSGEIVLGYKERNEQGQKDAGTINTMYIRTVNKNPGVLKGKYCNDIILEESGENELLLETIQASEDCLRAGGLQLGTFFVYGTGADMNRGSKGYKHIHHNLNAYNAEEWYVPAQVFYFPHYAGATDEKGRLVEDIPNLQHLSVEERVGMSDLVAAEVTIKKEKQRLLNEGDMEKYFNYCQNNPIDIKEIFRRTSTNNFDLQKLNDQLYLIDSGDIRYHRYVLKYKQDDKGVTSIPLEVEASPAKREDNENDCVYILNDGHPVKGYRFLYTGGTDSYDQDQSKTSKSLGAMVVFCKMHNIPNLPNWLPVALIRNRPRHKELFYELSVKLSIYYDLIGANLVDRGAGVIMQYYKNAGAERYLSKSCRKFESPNTTQAPDYGQSLNTYSIPKMISALQTYFDYHVHKVWFPKILEEALDYGEYSADSDWDTVDAFGLALMKAIDSDIHAVNDNELLARNPHQYPVWGEDAQGNVVDISDDSADDEPLGEKEDLASRKFRMLKMKVDNRVEENNDDDLFAI